MGERGGLELHHRARRRHADHDHGAASPHEPQAEVDGRGGSGRHDGAVDAATVRQAAHDPLRILGRGIDDVRRAERPRAGAPPGGEVDCDDRVGPRERSGLDAVEADPAGADHGDAVARFDARCVSDRAIAGGDAAGQQAGAVEGHLGSDGNGLGVVDEHLLGEGGGAQALDDLGAARVAQRAALVECERRLAERRLTAAAEVARPAGAHERHDHVVSRREPVGLGARGLHDPGRLVTVDRRQAAAPRARGVGHVAVADRACADPHADLIGARRGELDLLDDQGLAEAVADGCLHAPTIGSAGGGDRRRAHASAATAAGE